MERVSEAPRKAKARANGLPQTPIPTDGVFQHDLLTALQAMRSGNFAVRLPGNLSGIEGKISDVFNDIVEANQRMAAQLERVGQVVGREGKTRQRVKFGLRRPKCRSASSPRWSARRSSSLSCCGSAR